MIILPKLLLLTDLRLITQYSQQQYPIESHDVVRKIWKL